MDNISESNIQKKDIENFSLNIHTLEEQLKISDKLMEFDWIEYYDYAKQILNDTGANECSCRVGVSRFYYAAFHIAQKYAKQESITIIDAGKTHEKLWISLEQSNNNNAKRVAALGNALKRLRTISDYRSGISVDLRDLQNAFRHAEKILSLCNVTNC